MPGAAAVIRRNVRRSKTPGSRRPKLKIQRSDATASQRVGGYAGANFDNKSVGR